MKKIYSLIKASMTSDMSLFKIKQKKNSKSKTFIPLFIALYLMFMIWGSANSFFEKIKPFNMQHIMLSLFVFGISVTTFIEGIYKTGSLIFNCKDDQLLLSLPIKRRTILFIRIFKFYVFELLFNSMFILPVMLAYTRWTTTPWTYYLTCFVMLFILPIIPIVLSSIVGMFTSSLSSNFKYKNIAQIIISMIFLLGVLYLSFNTNKIFNYLVSNATNMNDLISKIYYPSGVFLKLITNFNILDLVIFILINIGVFSLTIFILSKFYFKINSRLKSVITSNNKKKNLNDLIIKSNSQIKSLVKKELNTFFTVPVFIINAGFALVLFIVFVIIILFKFDSFIPLLISEGTALGLTKESIFNNLSIIIFLLISLTSFMTSITNSVISLEGKNINILKSLPIKAETIIISKILAALIITTPVLLIGDIVLFIKFKINILEAIILLILSILVPLVSHFIGIIVNLKYPKLDFDNNTEVVKQSMSSFISVMIGMLLFIISMLIITNIIGHINSLLILIIAISIYIVLDIILYIYLMTRGVKNFNNLNI